MDAHRSRRSRGEKHPVIDFLFEYYRFRPSDLLRWSPGIGESLLDASLDFEGRTHFTNIRGRVEVSAEQISGKLLESSRWILNLLAQTEGRSPMLGCSGLHEWAMVYRESDYRHRQYPLRLTDDQIAEVVDAGPLVCTHYDAFRFFSEDARPLNRWQPTIAEMPAHEQPGCLHANMDLYRWATKRYPWVGSDLIREAFLLAMDIRAVDMRASPYDLGDLGYEAIPIESEVGRLEYRRLQLGFFERARPIRRRLIEAYERLLAAA